MSLIVASFCVIIAGLVVLELGEWRLLSLTTGETRKGRSYEITLY